MDPVKGNVTFSSALYGWSFTLESFSQLYVDVWGVDMDPKELARRLWGDLYFNPVGQTLILASYLTSVTMIG